MNGRSLCRLIRISWGDLPTMDATMILKSSAKHQHSPSPRCRERNSLIVSDAKQGIAFFVPSRSLTLTMIMGSCGTAGAAFFFSFFSFFSTVSVSTFLLSRLLSLSASCRGERSRRGDRAFLGDRDRERSRRVDRSLLGDRDRDRECERARGL